MMDKGERIHRQARARTKRFNKYMTVERFTRERWIHHPSSRFVKLDVRLIVLDWLEKFGRLCRMWRWCGDQHNCSCPMCRSHTRKVQGNRRAALPIGDIRQLDRMDADTAFAETTGYPVLEHVCAEPQATEQTPVLKAEPKDN